MEDRSKAGATGIQIVALRVVPNACASEALSSSADGLLGPLIMNSQNRMNAGAEYVLYRIWATLQDQKGIHAESLLACLGALAGYACQVYVRQAAVRAGADARKYALTTITTSDGTTYLQGDALNMPLADSPLSVRALVGRTVQKLGKQPPDIDGIFRHVTQTLGTSAFGVLRVSDGHRPRHPAIVYLKQIWPQILPIAQRFCRKPAQLPVLFGIALQRALEHTKDLLSPTLGASIAMECAVAMSKVALPGAAAVPVMDLWPTPMASSQPGTRAGSTPVRTTRTAKRKSTGRADAGALDVGVLAMRLPSAKIAVTIVSLAIILITGAMWRDDRRDTPEAARVERKLQSPVFQDSMREPERPIQETQVHEETQASEQAQQISAQADVPSPTPEQPANEGIIVEDDQGPLESSSDGGSEIT